jgi:hypothetical protein
MKHEEIYEKNSNRHIQISDMAVLLVMVEWTQDIKQKVKNL